MTSPQSPTMPSPTPRASLRDRFRRWLHCLLGDHPAASEEWAPYPYPARVYCPACQRTLYYVDHYAKVQVWDFDRNDCVEISGLRYRSIDQWRSERA